MGTRFHEILTRHHFVACIFSWGDSEGKLRMRLVCLLKSINVRLSFFFFCLDLGHFILIPSHKTLPQQRSLWHHCPEKNCNSCQPAVVRQVIQETLGTCSYWELINSGALQKITPAAMQMIPSWDVHCAANNDSYHDHSCHIKCLLIKNVFGLVFL